MRKFCLEPFVHVDIIVENANVYYKPCNVYTENFKSMDFTEVKTAIDSNSFASGCVSCKNSEQLGITSRRIGCNKIHSDIGITHTNEIQSLSFRYGTLCNSTCFICDYTRSSAWATKMKSEGKTVPAQFMYKKQEMVPIEKILTGIDLSKIRFVEFHGGEPLMATYPWEIISLLDKPNVSVKINTNGTIWPESMREFNECRRTEIIFSVDDIDNRLEYLRPPVKFDQLLKNIKQAKAMNFNIGCTYVMSGLNIYYLPEFIEWGLKTFGINLYGQLIFEPSEYSLYNLPISAKQKVEYKFNQYPEFSKLLQPALDDMFRDQQHYPTALLTLASTNKFIQAMPEWSKILND